MANKRPDFYNYDPSVAAAVIFTVVFAVSTTISCFQFHKALKHPNAAKIDKKRALVILPFIAGGLCEIVGCVCRIISSQNPLLLRPFVVQAVLLLVAAALFAATIYMVLGRIIAVLECHSRLLVPAKWLTKIFVVGDIVSFVMQGVGASVRASDRSRAAHAERIIIGGLFVQIGFFAVFMVVLALFQLQIRKQPSAEARCLRNVPSKWRNWQLILVVLFLCSLLILVRSIVRAVEFLQGFDGFLISNEVFIYTLDLLLMFLNMVLLSWQNVCGYFVEVGPMARSGTLEGPEARSGKLEGVFRWDSAEKSDQTMEERLTESSV